MKSELADSIASPAVGTAALFGAQLVANALVGYAFQKTFAYYYGASVEKSVFDVAFAVPTMLIYLSGLGYTHAVMISLFTKLRRTDPSALPNVFSTLVNVSAIALLALVTVTALLSRHVAAVLAPGLDSSARAALSALIVWMLPLAVAFGLSSHLSAVALAWRAPVSQEILLLVSRLAVVVWVFSFGRAVPLTWVAAVLCITSLLALVVQWKFLMRVTGVQYRPVITFENAELRNALHQFGGFFVVALAAQVSYAYGRRMGTIAGPSVVALLGFAASLIETLNTIASKVLAFQIGQPLAIRFAADSLRSVRAVHRITAYMTAAGLVVAVLIALAAEWLVMLFFGGGAFQADAVAETASYVRIMAAGIPAGMIVAVLVYPLLGRGRYAAAIVHTFGCVLHVAFVATFFSSLQGAAVAWAYVVLLWVQAVGGYLVLTRGTSS